MDEPQQRGTTSRKHVARLLIQGLTAADVEQVQAVVNNLRHHTFNDWHLVDQGPADLALTGHGTVAVRGLFREAKATLQVFEPVTRRPSRYGVLLTPLRYTALSTALTDVDRRLATRRVNAPDADVHDAATLVATVLPPLRRYADVGLRSVMEGQARVRLNRRPPTDLAEAPGDDALVRLLMAGHLSIDELVDASQKDRATCCALLRELAAAALLDIQMSPPSFESSPAGLPSQPTTPGRRTAPGGATRVANRASSADDPRGGLAQKLWRELGFVRS